MSLGNELGKNLSEQKEVNQSLNHDGGSIPKLIMPLDDLEIEEFNIVVSQRNKSGFILDSSRLGSEMGAGASEFSEIMRLAWEWDTETELEKGTIILYGKIDLTNGDIRLNIPRMN